MTNGEIAHRNCSYYEQLLDLSQCFQKSPAAKISDIIMYQKASISGQGFISRIHHRVKQLLHLKQDAKTAAGQI